MILSTYTFLSFNVEECFGAQFLKKLQIIGLAIIYDSTDTYPASPRVTRRCQQDSLYSSAEKEAKRRLGPSLGLSLRSVDHLRWFRGASKSQV